MAQPYAIVSCHVERLLDDRTWAAFSSMQERRPGGFEIAALLRPPDPEAGEDEQLWVARARQAADRGPLGLHTHWGGAEQARPLGGDPAERVRAEVSWLQERGFQTRLFCGGGWYMDEGVARTLAELGYTDCTATAFRPSYLQSGARRLSLGAPARVRLDAMTFLEIPATHSLGMAVRSAFGRLPEYVHVYFHDTDLLQPRRRRALALALAVLGRRCRRGRLDRLETNAEVEFAQAASSV